MAPAFRWTCERLECRRNNNIKTQIDLLTAAAQRGTSALRSRHSTLHLVSKDGPESQRRAEPGEAVGKRVKRSRRERLTWWMFSHQNQKPEAGGSFASRRPFLVSAVVDHKLINKPFRKATRQTRRAHKQTQQNTRETRTNSSGMIKILLQYLIGVKHDCITGNKGIKQEKKQNRIYRPRNPLTQNRLCRYGNQQYEAPRTPKTGDVCGTPTVNLDLL